MVTLNPLSRLEEITVKAKRLISSGPIPMKREPDIEIEFRPNDATQMSRQLTNVYYIKRI